jgi:Mitochondrial ribosomal subunit protein
VCVSDNCLLTSNVFPFLVGIGLDDLNDEEIEETAQSFAYYRRALRATYDTSDLEDYANVLEDEIGNELEFDGGLMENELDLLKRNSKNMNGVKSVVDDEANLPFSLSAIQFVSNVTWNAPPNTRDIDRKVTIITKVNELLPKKEQEEVANYVRYIASAHSYKQEKDEIKLSVDMYKDASMNQKAAIERIAKLVLVAKDLLAKHGPMKKRERPMMKYAE